MEFLKLCQNFGLTPTFAKVGNQKTSKWKQASKSFEENIIAEELKQKRDQIILQRKEVNDLYDEVRRNCTILRYMRTLQTLIPLNKRVYQDIINGHTKKVARMLSREMDVDEHIQNISSYKLSFFQKLILCCGLKFAIPRHVSAKEIQVSFERAYRTLEVGGLPVKKREITAAPLRSIALNCIERRGPSPSKSLQRALNQLKQRDDIVITKPDKRTGVVVMNKCDYIRLLSEASIDNESVSLDQPTARGRPIKHYHPLLEKEK